ncbi:hypothetical protein AAC978_01645 [Desulfitobacterium sp. THU1]|uniref:hypothetical protein n=1 Tax=Desulfitobacterium sp. THU1 TaxID=3138072 RepID=UPI00311F86E8
MNRPANNSAFVFTSPPAGAGFIAITLFFLIVFTANPILNSTTLRTLGIAVTLSVLGFLLIILMILFLL